MTRFKENAVWDYDLPYVMDCGSKLYIPYQFARAAKLKSDLVGQQGYSLRMAMGVRLVHLNHLRSLKVAQTAVPRNPARLEQPLYEAQHPKDKLLRGVWFPSRIGPMQGVIWGSPTCHM